MLQYLLKNAHTNLLVKNKRLGTTDATVSWESSVSALR